MSSLVFVLFNEWNQNQDHPCSKGNKDQYQQVKTRWWRLLPLMFLRRLVRRRRRLLRRRLQRLQRINKSSSSSSSINMQELPHICRQDGASIMIRRTINTTTLMTKQRVLAGYDLFLAFFFCLLPCFMLDSFFLSLSLFLSLLPHLPPSPPPIFCFWWFGSIFFYITGASRR